MFEHDRARILHSRAFRRLQAKTQVFPPSKKDFYRTRLTHSIECAQIGKALALNLWPESRDVGGSDLVEAACLAHDIGHPPCGHEGEAAIRELVSFDANAQNIRILTLLEEKELTPGEYSYGLNLTQATLASIIKYPYLQAGRDKEYLYDEDVERLPLPDLFDDSPFVLHENGDPNEPRPFPLQLMEWADDVAYSTHDVEDGINAGFISGSHLADDNFLHPLIQKIADRTTEMDRDSVFKQVKKLADQLRADLGPQTDPPAHRAKAVMDVRIHRFVEAAGRKPSPYPDDWLYAFDLTLPPETRFECRFLKELAKQCVFNDPRVTRLEYKRKKIIKEMCEAFYEDALASKHQLFPRSWWPDIAKAKLDGGDEACRRVVADYISGMSDSFCLQLFSELSDPQSGSAFVTA